MWSAAAETANLLSPLALAGLTEILFRCVEVGRCLFMFHHVNYAEDRRMSEHIDPGRIGLQLQFDFPVLHHAPTPGERRASGLRREPVMVWNIRI
jgi:hypothetical protein